MTTYTYFNDRNDLLLAKSQLQRYGGHALLVTSRLFQSIDVDEVKNLLNNYMHIINMIQKGDYTSLLYMIIHLIA